MSERIQGFFDDGVVVLTSPIDPTATEHLSTREAALVARAVPKRRNEFATARVLAREALALFGIRDAEILHDAKGAPVWPEGIAGSLTHCTKRALVAVGRSEAIGMLGIDAEDRPALPYELWPRILTPEELRSLEAVPESHRGRIALVMFSAKESLYKAQYPRTHEFMEFADARIDALRVEPGSVLCGTFTCVFERDVDSFRRGTQVAGRFRDVGTESTVVTAVQIRA
jgi:4'-phosphopantetheinyl transferase EntD